jgi:hypothetical protein
MTWSVQLRSKQESIGGNRQLNDAAGQKRTGKDGKSYLRWGWKMPRRDDQCWQILGAFVITAATLIMLVIC